MEKSKTVLKLHYEGMSIRNISKIVKKSRNTVSDIVHRSESLQLSREGILEMSEEDLNQKLFPDQTIILSYVKPDYAYCHDELKKPGVTLSLLYDEYVAQCKMTKLPYYKRSYFFEKYSEYVNKNRLTMHINHKPGDRVMVDWDGTTMEVLDRYTGEIYPAYIFVGTLPFSMLSYVQACPSMKIAEYSGKFEPPNPEKFVPVIPVTSCH